MDYLVVKATFCSCWCKDQISPTLETCCNHF